MNPALIQTEPQALFVLAVLDHLSEGGGTVGNTFRQLMGLKEPDGDPDANPLDAKRLLGEVYYFYNMPTEDGEIIDKSAFSFLRNGYALEPNGFFTTDNPEIIALADAGQEIINPLLDQIAGIVGIADYKISGDVIGFPAPEN